MATKSAGRVSIRVLPDSTGFRRDLQTALDRIERTMKAKIRADLVLTKESVAKLKVQLEDLQTKIKVEPYITEEDKHKVKKDLEDVKPKINVAAQTLNARREIATVARDRQVNLFVKVNKASAVAALTALTRLSGARVIGDYLEDFWTSIKNLDKNAPKLAAITTGILSLMGGVGALTSNIFALGGQLAQLGQISVLLPALFTGAGISIAVLVAAFKDMKKVLGDLAPAFHKLQDNISSKFWAQAAQPIRNLVNNLFPTLNKQLGNLASAWGRLFANLAKEIEVNATPKELTYMMGNLTKAVDIASKAMKPLVHAFNTLGSFGSNYLPRLSDWIVKLSNQFDRFITKAQKTGKLSEFAEEGIRAFKDLGRVLYETGRVAVAVNMAAQLAGGSTMGMLADGLKKLSDTIRKPEFQNGLAAIFTGAHAAMDGIVQGLSNLGPGLAKLAPILSQALGRAGDVVATAMDTISSLISSPKLHAGLLALLDGFVAFVADLKPAMAPLGEILGTFGDMIGAVLSNFGPVFAETIKQLAPVFTEVWAAIKPLLPDLADLTQTLIKELGPVLVTFAKEVLPELIPLVKDLIPIIKDLIKVATPALSIFFKNLGASIREAQPYLSGASKWIDDIVTSLKGLPEASVNLNQNNPSGFLSSLADIIKNNPNLAASLAGIGTALNTMGLENMTQFAGFLNNISMFNTPQGLYDLAVALPNIGTALLQVTGLQPAWDGFWQGLSGSVSLSFPQILANISMGLIPITAVFSSWFVTGKFNWDAFWMSLSGPIIPALGTSNVSVNAGLASIAATVSGWMGGQNFTWTGFWTTLAIKAQQGMSSLNINIGGGFPAILASVAAGMAGMGIRFDQGWAGILVSVTSWFAQIVGGINSGVGRAVEIAAGLPGQVLAALTNFDWGQFASAGAAMVDAFAGGIGGAISKATGAMSGVLDAVRNMIPHSPAKTGPFSGAGWTQVGTGGAAIVEEFARGMGSRKEMLRATSADVIGTAGFGVNRSHIAGAMKALQSDTGSAATGPLVAISVDKLMGDENEVARSLDQQIRRGTTISNLRRFGVK